MIAPTVLLTSEDTLAAPAAPPQIYWPAFGVSHYMAATDPACDPDAYAEALVSVGAEFTRVWLCDPWACGTGETGCYEGYVPVMKLADGRWDLFTWNPAYFERLKVFTQALWRRGLWPQYTLLNLYQFSPRKEGMLWVPDMNRLPWRHNVNGVSWGVPDEDATFRALPDQWLSAFISRVVDTLGPEGQGYILELGNEMPEKEMHERMADTLRDAGYRGEITVNRNEDTPGQYVNMKIGDGSGRYQRLAHHGQGEIEYLDVVHEREPVHQTFRARYDDPTGLDMGRLIWSGDGVGENNLENTYDEEAILEVVYDMGQRGGSIEWQAREWKLGRFLLGRFNINDLYVDFTRRMRDAWDEGRQA